MNLAELEVEVLKLDSHARAQLAATLLQSLETLSDVEHERLWAEEALRRDEELEAGAATPRSAAEVFREARARLA